MTAAAAYGKNLTIRSARPEDFEMTLAGFDSWLTPLDSFYVRTHTYTPEVNEASWQLRVDGLVNTPLTLNLSDIRKLPRTELVSVIECAGNGRAFYRPTVAGTQWQYGAVGNARWTGVRLADVLKRAGVKDSSKDIAFNGADKPIGTMPDFVRSVPIAKAMHQDTLLAYEMNGQPLPLSHGFPLRLVVPGWAGDSWVKWVTDIQVLDKEYDGFFMKTAYRHPSYPVAPNTVVDPAQMVSVAGILPKSVIASPVEGEKVKSGPRTIRGAAWAGESPLSRVDVSVDNGRTWHAGRLTGDSSKYGWRLWEAAWDVPQTGSYVLMARATDRAGATQPLTQEWNPSGYLWNVVQQVRVEAGDTAAPPAIPVASEVEFPANVKEGCLACHGAEVINGQHLTPAQWEKEIDKMLRWGAKIDDRGALVEFLSTHFKP